MEQAPYHAVPEGEPVAQAYWTRADDGIRLRVASWSKEDAKGTVLLFPGRTEYIEKYAITAGEFAHLGYGTFSIDWRGQGLSDRVQANVNAGDVVTFSDYQRDVAAFMEAAETLNLPKPFFLLGHSMGGAIGLRALYNDLPVQAAAFTGPMWNIGLGKMRPFAYILSIVLRALGMSKWLAPGTKNETYVLDTGFEDNQLTKDRGMYARLQAQARANIELCIGGPTIRWVNEALKECADMAKKPAPSLPCVTFLGTDETIVDPDAIKSRMADWNDGTLEMVEAGEHEVLMEDPAKRAPIMAKIGSFFDQHR
ncbi:alpha/beta fold hydrolase [Cognatishimia activa]|uniref:Phospholipase YtpA n=1 Tax=Cognatishimia activa TaxID=1715691 RepID=A0A0P1IRH0_9RHOB|nr:alpha/beta hydrolase [Cognatishimia activa]CUI28527.1 Phospholipase YtpA [Cognatishimia activa]CUK24277.1 Phospholipase YtpA [Cognatishimia activa]